VGSFAGPGPLNPGCHHERGLCDAEMVAPAGRVGLLAGSVRGATVSGVYVTPGRWRRRDA